MTPNHIAIIMDGNGRWAEHYKRPRAFGHIKGAKSLRNLLRKSSEINVKVLTLYAFSMENWERPKEEVDFLMNLMRRYLKREYKNILKNNIRFRILGFTEPLPPDIREKTRQLEEASKENTGLFLNFALSYGSRQEIVQSMRSIAKKVRAGELSIDNITEKTISEHLFTYKLPEPDLLIRTGGNHRMSNFLLWQSAYTELYFTDVYWPEFTSEHLEKAIATFAKRERRFGNLASPPPAVPPSSSFIAT